MNKDFKQKQFKDMSNEELCAIAARLKFQLVEARFKMSSGEIEKVSVVKQIRKTIARVFTELTNRGYKVSIGVHGITMYDLKTNKPKSLDPKKIQELMDKQAKKEQPKAEKKAEAKKPETKKEPAKATVKEVKPEAKKQETKKGDNK